MTSFISKHTVARIFGTILGFTVPLLENSLHNTVGDSNHTSTLLLTMFDLIDLRVSFNGGNSVVNTVISNHREILLKLRAPLKDLSLPASTKA